MTTTASAKLIDPVLQVARHFQQDSAGLLHRIGITPEAIDSAGARIPAALFSTLLQELALNTDNPRIALRCGEATQPRMLGSVGFLMATAPTLGDAYRLLNDYLPLLIEGVHLSLEQQEDGASLLLDLQDDGDRPLAEWLLACLHSWPRWLIGKQMPLRQVDLAFAEPLAPALYEQFFAAEVQFNADRNRLYFAAEVLQQPCLDANEELHRHHLQFADQLLSSATRDGALVAQVKGLIRTRIAAGDALVSRDQVAAQLHLSLRTLQRKLDQHDTHFQALYDHTRRDMALQLIHRGDRSFGEIAYQLGFSGLSAFQKAFKRWTGQAPGRYRTSQRPRTIVPDQPLARTLADRVAQGVLDETAFYPIALQLIDLLQGLKPHQPPPLLHPALINLRTDERGALLLSLSGTAPHAALPLAEQVAYSAPEANGLLPDRPRRATQLYELGCLYYFLLQGHPPHRAGDISVLLRAQLQHTVVADSALPAPLRALLHKLLALELDARYQTLGGLEQDLRQLQLLGATTPATAAFIPGSADQPDHLLSAERLSGRTAQQQQLQHLLQRCRHNDGRLLLLEGPPGSGKTALVDNLRRSVFRSQGMLLRLPFTQGDRARRLDPLLPPLRSLLRHKLSAPAARRQLWAQQLERQLGSQLALLYKPLPELKLLTAGATPTAPRRHYLDQLLTGIASLLGQQRDPLVLFFDNLHFASSETLALIQQLQTRLGSQPLLLIAAYDDTQLTAESPLQQSLPLLRGHRQSTHLQLPALTRPQVHQLLAALLGDISAATHILGDWLYQRSQGNPGRLHQQLENLRQQQKLRFDGASGHWQWLPETLPVTMARELEQTLAELLQRLPPATLELLQWAAMIGERFELALLAAARQYPPARIAIHLWPAEQAGILRPGVEARGAGRFSHPAICARLLAQLDDSQTAYRHERIAQALLERPAPDAAARRAATRHGAAAYRLSPQPERRLELARQHRDSARLARDSAESSSALSHYRAAFALLQPDDGRAQGELCRTILAEGSELLLHAGALDEAEQWVERLQQFPHLLGSAALRNVYPILCAQLRYQRDDPAGAQALLCAALDQQGITLSAPGDPLSTALYRWLEQPSPVNGSKGSDPLLDALQLLAEQRLQPALLLSTLLARVQQAESAAPIAAQVLRQQLLGSVPLTPAASPGALSPPRLSEQWLDGARRLPWCAPLGASIATLQQALLRARHSGQEQLARQLLLPLYHSRWFGSETLTEIEPELRLELARQPAGSAGQGDPPGGDLLHLIGSLTDPGHSTASVADPDSAAGWPLLSDVCLAFLTQQRHRWPLLTTRALAAAPQFGGLLAEAQLLLFCALMAAELAHPAVASERQRWRQLLLQQQVRFELWAAANPALFAAPAALLAAEGAALRGADAAASRAFEDAIAAADGSGSRLLAGLCRARFSDYWQRRQHRTLAQLLHDQAQQHYQHWGALGLTDSGARAARGAG